MNKLQSIKKVVMYESDEAASIKTVTGWVDRNGRFWGEDEHMARYCGSTHRQCVNDPKHPIYPSNAWCDVCHSEKRKTAFDAMPAKTWCGEPLVIHDTDIYFFDSDDLRDHCMEHSILPEEMNLVICEPNYPREIDGSDHLVDDLPEDGELPGELQDAFDVLNAVIRKSGPLSWSAGKFSATVPADIFDDDERQEIIVSRTADPEGDLCQQN